LCLDVTVTATSKNTTKSAGATGTAGMTLQNGVEMLNLVTLTTFTVLTALVTDLSEDVLWAYDPGTSVPAGSLVEPIKLLPNGHSLITFTVSTAGLELRAAGSVFGGNRQWIWREQLFGK